MLFRKNSPIDTSQAESIPMSAILKLLEENDIIELELLIGGTVIKIGASSDFDHRRRPEFFDKWYYISDFEYDSISQFFEAFSKLSPLTMQTVLRIDGVAPKHHHFPDNHKTGTAAAVPVFSYKSFAHSASLGGSQPSSKSKISPP